VSDHVNAFARDALLLGALPQAEAARVREHLAACDACRGERDADAAMHAEFRARVLPRTLPQPRRRWWMVVALPALAAVALVLVLRHGDPREPDLGIKGGAAWQVVALHGDHELRVHDGTRLAAGDKVRFVVVPNGAHYVTIASIDGAGAASIYYAAVKLDGPRVELPDSIVLDAAPGPERLFALFSDAPLDPAPVTAQLGKLAGKVRETTKLDLAVRAQLTVMFEKEPR
jgi:putative zinc finger protein